MSRILEDIKAASFTARKNREVEKASSLITLLSEAQMVGKNKGRETTDEETIAVIKKFIKNIDETLRLGTFAHGDVRAVNLINEKSLFGSFLPAQLTEEKIREILINIVNVNGFDVASKPMGDMLKILKFNYEGRYDGGLAARLAKEVIATWQS
jgi:uncharacterized protein YqeY